MLSARSCSVPQHLDLKVNNWFLFAFCHLAFFQAAKSILSCPIRLMLLLCFNLRQLCAVFGHEGMETGCVCLLKTTAGQWLTCCAFSLSVFVVCTRVPLPAEMSIWSQLLVQCATYSILRGKVHVHAFMCVVLLHASCFRATTPNVFGKCLSGVSAVLS